MVVHSSSTRPHLICVTQVPTQPLFVDRLCLERLPQEATVAPMANSPGQEERWSHMGRGRPAEQSAESILSKSCQTVTVHHFLVFTQPRTSRKFLGDSVAGITRERGVVVSAPMLFKYFVMS